MNEWMNARMNELTNEWTNEWMNEWMNELTNEWMHEWMNEWTNEWINAWMNEWMNELANEWMNVENWYYDNDRETTVVGENLSNSQVKESYPCTGLGRPLDLSRLRLPWFPQNRLMKVVRLLALCTSRLYPQEIFPVLI